MYRQISAAYQRAGSFGAVRRPHRRVPLWRSLAARGQRRACGARRRAAALYERCIRGRGAALCGPFPRMAAAGFLVRRSVAGAETCIMLAGHPAKRMQILPYMYTIIQKIAKIP